MMKFALDLFMTWSQDHIILYKMDHVEFVDEYVVGVSRFMAMDTMMARASTWAYMNLSFGTMVFASSGINRHCW